MNSMIAMIDNDDGYLSTRKPLYTHIYTHSSNFFVHNYQIMISRKKNFSQLISFSDGLVQAEATSRTRADR